MSKTFNKPVKKAPRPTEKPEDTAILVREDLEEQLDPLSPEATAGTGTHNAPAATATEPGATAKPLAPLAALWPKSAPPLASVTSETTGAVAEPAAGPETVKVTLVFSRPGAKSVAVCGDFNNWLPAATPMKEHDGHWQATLTLPVGNYQYKFLVDGEWVLDPAAPKRIPNQYGSLNSVLEVRA